MNAINGPDDSTPRRWCRAWIWWAVAVLVTIWLLWMTQRPQDIVSADLEVLTKPAASRGISSRLLIGILGNIAVFVPLGAAVAQALACRSHRAVVVAGLQTEPPLLGRVVGGTGAGLALSIFIELLQHAQPTRVTDLEDVALNTLGALIGALLVVSWHIGSRRLSRRASNSPYHVRKGGTGGRQSNQL